MNFKDNFGYFGSGLDGYAHYKQAFDNSFPPLAMTKISTSMI